MRVGTEVSDTRNHRRLGFWNGAGLTDVPPEGKPQPQAPDRAELLTVMNYEPASPSGFGAALWILTNSPDGADVQKAADVILQSHIQSPEMGRLIEVLERMRPACTSNLLQSVLNHNPDAKLRGKACMALAELRKEAASYGTNKLATAEAEKLYERVIAEFGQLPSERGYTFAELAKPLLAEIRQLWIGKSAPAISGQDLDGHSMKLSDYRGKVVVLLFWYSKFDIGESHNYRRLVGQMKGKPFALLGIYTDRDGEEAKAVAEEQGMNWPSFQDGRDGPICNDYHINAFPTIFVLDRKGVIRYRGLYHCDQVAVAVEKLLKE
jgi:peroxiredoxin